MEPSNVLHIQSLRNGWCDKDYVMLHACFQLLADFVEQEMMVDWWVNWDQDEGHRKAKEEIIELYEWWFLWLEKPESTSFVEDEVDYGTENKMLKRLIDVRMYMWT